MNTLIRAASKAIACEAVSLFDLSLSTLTPDLLVTLELAFAGRVRKRLPFFNESTSFTVMLSGFDVK
jgi:hypothetical protein